MLLRQLLDARPVPYAAGQRFRNGIGQAIIKSFRKGADLSPAIPSFLRTELVLRGDFHGKQLGAPLLQKGKRIRCALSPRRSRGQIQHPAAFALAQRTQSRIKRRHRLADARRRLRKEPLSVPDGDVYARRKPPLSRPITVIGKRQRIQRRIPHPSARQHRFFPNARSGAQRSECLLKALFLRVLFVTGDALALLIDIQDAKPYAAQPIPRAEHMTVYRCLRPVRRNQRVILRAELDLLDDRRPVLAEKQPVCPAGNMQRQRIGFIIRTERLLRPIRRFAPGALFLSGLMGSSALPHALRRTRRG